ncbi:MAG: beta-lactamase family protein [Bacteroidota bacterium]|nr:beta-lactamase family protein [Bacteroidota bacterium]
MKQFLSACLFASIVVITSLFSCGAEPSLKNEEKIELVDTDSIDKLLLAIHAKEKSYRIDTLMKNRVKQNGFNGCILVAQQGQVIYKKAFGYKDLKAKDSLHLTSAFQLASVSKTLTAAAVLLLKDRGKLKLGDQLETFFPGFPYKGISIHHLLSHRSGLGNYLYFGESYCDSKHCYKGKVMDNAAVLDMLMNEKPAAYAPAGKKFEYCNTNYVLLALVIEKVSGQTFPEFMEENIFRPLEMNNTWVQSAGNSLKGKDVTKGHTAGGKTETDTYGDEVLGDKAIFSTVEDLFKWDRALYSDKLLKEKTIEEAFSGYSNEHKGIRNYGYGWRLTENSKDDKTIYHNGWWHGYSSLFYRRPADQITVIILSNKYSKSVYRIDGVLSILGDKFPSISSE